MSLTRRQCDVYNFLATTSIRDPRRCDVEVRFRLTPRCAQDIIHDLADAGLVSVRRGVLRALTPPLPVAYYDDCPCGRMLVMSGTDEQLATAHREWSERHAGCVAQEVAHG